MHPDTPQSRPVTFLTWFGSAVLVFTVLVLAGQAASAMAANISYVGSDGNVWRISPDGVKKQQLTGTPARMTATSLRARRTTEPWSRSGVSRAVAAPSPTSSGPPTGR